VNGKLLFTAKTLVKDHAPQQVIEKVLGHAGKYLTLKFSTQTCKIDALYEQDGVWWESDTKTGKFTGRYGLAPRAQKHTDRAEFRWLEIQQ
jgi:hypothetical protein